MMRVVVVLALSAVSAFVPGVAVGTMVAMVAAALVGFAAVRLHAAAETLALGGDAAAASLRRAARFCDDLALALCLLALLYAVRPF